MSPEPSAAPVRHPIFLDLRGHLVVVVGGGAVAERKVEALLETGARIVVVSPGLTATLSRLVADTRVEHVGRRYRPGDLHGARLAYVATGDERANALVRGEASREGVLLNVADDPARCDFFAPSVVRRGELTVAISTNGASPVLARRLRERLGRLLGSEYEPAVRRLRELREQCRAAGLEPRLVREQLIAEMERLLPDLAAGEGE